MSARGIAQQQKHVWGIQLCGAVQARAAAMVLVGQTGGFIRGLWDS